MNPKIGPLEEGPPSRFRTPKKYSFKTELEGLKMKKTQHRFLWTKGTHFGEFL